MSWWWVPTDDCKRDWLNFWQASCECFKHTSNNFLYHFSTGDESWVHFYTSKTKQLSKQWFVDVGTGRRSWKQFRRLERWWSLFSGIPMGLFWYTTCKKQNDKLSEIRWYITMSQCRNEERKHQHCLITIRSGSQICNPVVKIEWITVWINSPPTESSKITWWK